jgi:hypothetical protein
MPRLNLIRTVLFVGVCSAFGSPAFAQHEHPAGDPTKLGKVNFPVSVMCQFKLNSQAP